MINNKKNKSIIKIECITEELLYYLDIKKLRRIIEIKLYTIIIEVELLNKL